MSTTVIIYEFINNVLDLFKMNSDVVVEMDKVIEWKLLLRNNLKNLGTFSVWLWKKESAKIVLIL